MPAASKDVILFAHKKITHVTQSRSDRDRKRAREREMDRASESETHAQLNAELSRAACQVLSLSLNDQCKDYNNVCKCVWAQAAQAEKLYKMCFSSSFLVK